MRLIPEERRQLDEMGELFDTACEQVRDRGDLLVAFYEICIRYQRLIINALPQTDEEWARCDELRQHLFDQLKTTKGDQQKTVTSSTWIRYWSLPSGFVMALKEEHAACEPSSYDLPRLILAVLTALDESFQLWRATGGNDREFSPGYLPLRLVPSSLCQGERYWVWLKPPLRITEANDQNLAGDHNLASERWLENVSIIPHLVDGVRTVLALPAPEVARSLDPNRPVRVGVWPIARDITPGLEHLDGCITDYHGDRHTLYRVSEPRQAIDYDACFRESILPQCREQDVSLLIMPELSVGPRFREAIADALKDADEERRTSHPERPPRPVLVVAGSFHEAADEGDAFWNRTTVLDYCGGPAQLRCATPEGRWGQSEDWRHAKLTRFRVKRTDIEEAIGKERVPKTLLRDFGLDRDKDLAGAVEPSRLGLSVRLVNTPIGRLCVVICIDYLDACHRWHDPLQRAWVDWWLVPAASHETKRFLDPAARWAYDDAASVIANACWLIDLFDTWESADTVHAKVPQPWQTHWLDRGLRPESARCTCDCSRGCLWVMEAREPTPTTKQPNRETLDSD